MKLYKKRDKRKEILSVCMTVILFVGFFFVLAVGSSVQAAPVKYGINNKGKGDWAYHVLDAKKKTVEIRPAVLCKDKKGVTKGSVTIPATITGQDGKTKYTVTKIADEAFSECLCKKHSKDGNLEMRWKCDGYKAVYNDIEITDVTIPAKVTEIGDYAFADTFLKKVIFKGDVVTTIGGSAFEDTNLTSIVIPQNVTTIGSFCFSDCSDLKTVTFRGNAVKIIERYAFNGTGLTSIVIPEKVEIIEDGAFEDCHTLASVNFRHKDLNKYHRSAFWDASVRTVYIRYVESYPQVVDLVGNHSSIKVISDVTRLSLIYQGKTKTVDVPKGKTLDLLKQFNVPEGKTLKVNSVSKYIDSCDNTYKNPSPVSDVYRATGHPYETIWLELEDAYYTLQNTEYPLIKSCTCHDANSCDLVRSRFGNHTYCYFDRLTLEELPTDAKYNRTGYQLKGFKINNRVYAPGAVVNGLSKSRTAITPVELYYEPNRYKIHYDYNGGVGAAIKDRVCSYGEKVKLAGNRSYNGDYKFLGWCMDKEGNGTIYKNESEVLNLTAKNGETVTLYAIWGDEALTLTFYPMGGTVSPASKKVRYNQTYGNLPTPKRKGYEFKGWTLGQKGGSAVTGGSKVTSNCDFGVFAQWKEKQIKVIFHANGGEGGSSKKVTYGKSVGTLPRAKRKGYKFKGWYTAKSGGAKISASTKVTEQKTFYAQWEEKTKTVKIKVKLPKMKNMAGYKIVYGKEGGKMKETSGKATSAKTVTITIKGAKTGETYVAKAKTYKKVKGKKKWSKWKSTSKTVK